MVNGENIMLITEIMKARLREGSPDGRLAFSDDEHEGYPGSNEKQKPDCKPDGIILEDDGY